MNNIFSERANEFGRYLDGDWVCEFMQLEKKHTMHLHIPINSFDDVLFKHIIEGTEVENVKFPYSAHWFEPYLVVIDTMKYSFRFINSEDLDERKNNIIFGEIKDAIIGDMLWEKRFNRVDEFSF